MFVKPVLGHAEGSKLTTVNTYVPVPVTGGDAAGVFGIRGLKSKTLVLTAATNDLKFQIEFSPDGTYWSTRLTDIVVAAGAWVLREDIGNTEIRGYWRHARISVKPNVNDTHGTGTFWFEAGTL